MCSSSTVTTIIHPTKMKVVMKNIRVNTTVMTKSILFGVILVIMSNLGISQTINNIESRISRIAGQNDISGQTNKDNVMVSKEYLDGLGRPVQSVQRWGSPLGYDMVVPTEYDALGRKVKKYLPYVHGGITNGALQTSWTARLNSCYDNVGDDIANTNFYWSESDFEPSPLNRVEKGYAPGEVWAKSSGNRPVESKYLTNLASDNIVVYYVDGNGYLNNKLSGEKYHGEGELYKNITIDEHGNQTIEFTNVLGQVVLKKVQAVSNPTLDEHWYRTYYVYDDFDRLRFVLPPKLVKHFDGKDITAATFTGNFEYHQDNVIINDSYLAGKTFPYTIFMKHGSIATIEQPFTHNKASGDLDIVNGVPASTEDIVVFEELAFQYDYDKRGRMVGKKVPGSGWVHMVYDKWDRLVLTQDPNLRQSNQWIFTKYDQLSRPVITGIHTNTGSASTIQNNLESESIHHESSGTTHGYSNSAFPTTNINAYHTITYYDDYTTIESQSGLAFQTINESSNGLVIVSGDKLSSPKGLVVGTKTNILGTSLYEYSVTYYDEKQRPIEVVLKYHDGNTERVFNSYDFIGNVLVTKTVRSGGNFSVPEYHWFTYDHMNRLTQVEHQLGSNSSDKVIMKELHYNELGELIEQNIDSDDNGSNFVASTDYVYNIRGWMTHINTPDLSVTDPNSEPDAFGMELIYDAAGEYNGNIGEIRWKNLLDAEDRKYGYNYDPLNRLTQADYGVGATFTDTKFDVNSISYDENGNILNLQRRGVNGSGTAINMDNLSYSYLGNQLTKVDDSWDDGRGFVDGASTTNEYLYDLNGNMTIDKNKGISSITYNVLNLPEVVTMDNGTTVEYDYRADGIKVAKRVTASGETTSTLYRGNEQHEQEVLSFLMTDAGRATPRILGKFDKWQYEHFVKDHLGNSRASVRRPDTFVYDATMESSNASTEEQVFSNMDTRQQSNARTGTWAALTSGTQRVGPMIALKVAKGDDVDLEVYGKYVSGGGTSNTPTLAGFAGTLADGLTGSSASLAESSIDFIGGFTEALNVLGFGGDGSTTEGAYLNYLIFSEDFTYQSAGFKELTTGSTYTLLDIPNISITTSGYLVAYVSYESDNADRAFFDDFKVVHTQASVIQQDDYYPFGLTFNSYVSGDENLYKYNGKEEQKETGWYDYGARMYMADVGRWGVIDPAADEYFPISPYTYVANNPLIFIDPTGERLYFVGGANNDQDGWNYINRWGNYFTQAGIRGFTRLNASTGKSGDIAFTSMFRNTGGYFYNDELSGAMNEGPSYFRHNHRSINTALDQIQSDLENNPLEDGEQFNLAGYSYGSVLQAQVALKLADKGTYIDNLILIGSPISDESDLFKELSNNDNIGNILRVDIEGDLLSNPNDVLEYLQGAFQNSSDDGPHFDLARPGKEVDQNIQKIINWLKENGVE